MEQSQVISETDVRSRLLETARAMVLRGEQKFSIANLCAEAGVERAAFRAHFSGKTQLMAVLMAEAQSPATPTPQPVAAPAPVLASVPAAEAPKTEPITQDPTSQDPTPKAALEPSVSTPDAWLERRLRVFERALTALEAKAEANSREQARIIAELEEKLAKVGPASAERPQEQRPAAPAAPVLAVKPQAAVSQAVAPARPPEQVAEASEDSDHSVVATAQAGAEAEEAGPEKNPNLLEITPAPAISLSKEEMAEVVQAARGKVRAAAAAAVEPKPKMSSPSRARWLAIGGLSLLVLFLCIGLSLGKGALATGASAATEGDGVAHLKAPNGALARTIALADSGDVTAEAKLAMIYLKGDGVKADAAAALRWSRAAAEAGQPVAEYVLGSLYREGSVVPADAAKAFALFEAAATKGNLKAMHNLAIAYAEGLGTDKDEAKAAEWFKRAAERGYVDSAFDLAVLYERGLGVTQDLKEALTWYGIAARMGDVPAEQRVSVLREQISSEAASLAADAAKSFTPLAPLSDANRL